MESDNTINAQLREAAAHEQLITPLQELKDAAHEAAQIDIVHNGDNRLAESFTRHARMIEDKATRYLAAVETKPGFTQKAKGETAGGLHAALSAHCAAFIQDYDRYVVVKGDPLMIASANTMRTAIGNFNDAYAAHGTPITPRSHPRVTTTSSTQLLGV